jgi:hypothetical protein
MKLRRSAWVRPKPTGRHGYGRESIKVHSCYSLPNLAGNVEILILFLQAVVTHSYNGITDRSSLQSRSYSHGATGGPGVQRARQTVAVNSPIRSSATADSGRKLNI